MDIKDVKIKNVKSSYTLILTKMNGENMGFIPCETIDSLSRGIKSVSELSFSVSKYYGANYSLNTLYDEIKVGRCIKLDEEEEFVIYEVNESKKEVKTISAYGKEKKLFKINAEFEDIVISLLKKDEEIPDCYTLDELLYKDTGWHLGYISPKVEYNTSETILDVLEGKTSTLLETVKIRYQEDVSTNWYDYINEEISEQFECYPVFDSYNKLVHLYSDDELGNKMELLLSYDNYLKNHEETTSIDDIITRMTVTGNDDLTILEENPTGERYIEDFSYFVEQKEMSDGLIKALADYEVETNKRITEWYALRGEKLRLETELEDKKMQLTLLYKKIQATKLIIDNSSDEAFKAQKQEELVELLDKQYILENGRGEEKGINVLTIEIKNYETQIFVINMLCKKENATYASTGTLIFNEQLLNELKEFIFCDSYSNDCITEALDLYKMGQRQLKKSCRPTITWSVDTFNFVNKLIDNKFRQQWNGELALGDMIMLLDNEGKITPVYFVGYTQKFKKGEESIELELSNMKENNNFSLTIGERLTLAKQSYKIIKSKKCTINKLRRIRIGLKYDKFHKKIL